MKQEIDKKVMFVIMIMAIILVPVYKLITNKDNKIEEKSATNEIRKNKLAMYVEDGDTYREYKGGDKFPEGYKLNIEKSKCEDNKGNEITPIDNVLSHDGMKVTVKSNKTIYCTLYFDEVPSPDDFIYYIKSNSSPKYTNKETNTVYIKHEMEEIESYCITEEETSENCTWLETNGSKDIQVPYTFNNTTNEEKKVKVYLKDAYEDISHPKEDKIIFDNVAPVINTLTVANLNSRQYKGTISQVTETGSGIDKYYFSNTGSNYTNGAVNNITYSGTKGAAGKVYAYVTDKAGNTSTTLNKGVTIGGTGTSADPYHIYYIEDLVDLANNVNGGNKYAGKNFVLDRSLDFKTTGSYENSTRTNYGDINGASGTQGLLTELTTGKGWRPIGNTTAKYFGGIFDGKNYTLSNIYQNNTATTSGPVGLFGTINGSTIKNLTVTGSNASTIALDKGGIIGRTDGTTRLENLTNSVSVSSTVGSNSIGGIVGANGANTNLTIINSTNKGAISGGNNTGGIVGYTNGTLTITNCTNSGAITNSLGVNVGGILGRDNATTNVTTITNSKNTNTVTISTNATLGAGGIVGVLNGRIISTNNYNSGKISNTGAGISTGKWVSLGGIIGYISGSHSQINQITSSYNTGVITGGNRNGGLVGYNLSKSVMIINKSYNTGAITTKVTVEGSNMPIAPSSGLVGYNDGNYETSNLFILNSYNTGNISSTGLSTGGELGPCRVSGITQTNYGGITYILNSYNTGVLTAGYWTNGIDGSYGRGSGATIVINNAYSNATHSGSYNYGIGWFKTSAVKVTITNGYYKSGTYASGGLGAAMDSAAMTNGTLLNSLNSRKPNPGSINSILNGYASCTWKAGTNGPVLDFSTC